VIPDEAVEAAAKVIAREVWRTAHSRDVAPTELARLALQAAAPHLMVAAWDEGYEKGLVGAVRIDSTPDRNPYRKAPDV